MNSHYHNIYAFYSPLLQSQEELNSRKLNRTLLIFLQSQSQFSTIVPLKKRVIATEFQGVATSSYSDVYQADASVPPHASFIPLTMDEKTTSATPISTTILVIVAGTNEPSNSNVLADTMTDAMRGMRNITVSKLRLKDLHMAHFGLECHGPHCPIDDLEKVRDLITKAHGVVIATPVWNFSIPAHLKNLIDRMGTFSLDEKTHSLGMLRSKPFYLIITGGMLNAGWPLLKRTTSHLPVSIQYYGGTVLGTHFEGSATLGQGIFGLVVDKRPASLEAIKRKGVDFVRSVQSFQLTGVLPLKYRMIQKSVRFAQIIKQMLGL